MFCFGVDKQFKVEFGVYDIFVKQFGFGGFSNCMVQMYSCFDIFVVQEDVIMICFQCECGDQYVFYQQVWQLFYQQMVFIGVWFYFIGVIQQVMDVYGFIFWYQVLFQIGGKVCVVVFFQIGVFYLVDDFIWRQVGQCFMCVFVVVFVMIFIQLD